MNWGRDITAWYVTLRANEGADLFGSSGSISIIYKATVDAQTSRALSSESEELGELKVKYRFLPEQL